MKTKGYHIDNENPNAVKYEVAKEQGVPLKEGYNGHLTSEQAGKVGGPIGGNMVKQMVRMAQEKGQRDRFLDPNLNYNGSRYLSLWFFLWSFIIIIRGVTGTGFDQTTSLNQISNVFYLLIFPMF